MDVSRPCGVRKSKTNPNPYTKEELVKLAVDLGYTKTEAKKMTVKELCEILKKKPKKSLKKSSRKTLRKSSRKTSRKSVKKTSRKSVKKTSRKSVKKSSRKNSRKNVKKTSRKVSKKTSRKVSKKSSRKIVKKSSRKVSRKSSRKNVKKPSRKVSIKPSRKTVKKPSRKSSRKSPRKSIKKSSRKTVRKSPKKSIRKSSRKSVRKSSRKISRKSLREVFKSGVKRAPKCKNDIDILSQEEIKDIPKEKLIRVWTGYCYNIDYLVEYLISSKDMNKDPADNKYELWKDSRNKKRIINHKGLDPEIKKRYFDMLDEYEKESKKFIENLVSNEDNIKLLNDIATLGFIFRTYDYSTDDLQPLGEILKNFYKIFNKNKDKDLWSRMIISNNSLGQILQDTKNTCNHMIGLSLIKYYFDVYKYVTETYKKDIPLSKYFYKHFDQYYDIKYMYDYYPAAIAKDRKKIEELLKNPKFESK